MKPCVQPTQPGWVSVCEGPHEGICDPWVFEPSFEKGLEQGRKEGIAAVIAALEAESSSPESTRRRYFEEWLESPKGQAAVAAELAKIGGGT